jgi:hypothetical protein
MEDRMTSKLAIVSAFIVIMTPMLASAERPDEGPPGRYQLAVRQGAVGETLFMIDTATGHTWRLQSVPAPTVNGSPGVVERWFPIEMDNQPVPPEPIPASK